MTGNWYIEVSNAIHPAQVTYGLSLSQVNIWASWEGLKNMANIKDQLKRSKAKISVSGVDSTPLTNALNAFCAPFQTPNVSRRF